MNFTTQDGTATGDIDYQPLAGTLTFQPGEVSKDIVVKVLGDTLNEVNENFFVQLSDARFVTVVRNRATGTILDDDALPSLSIDDVPVSEGNSGEEKDVVLTITLSAPSGQEVQVDYATEDGTAVAGQDYEATKGTAVFAAEGQGAQVAVAGSARKSSADIPRLDISVTGGKRVITWVSAATFELQETSALTENPIWTRVNGTIDVQGNQHTVTVDDSNSVRFYRLRPVLVFTPGEVKKLIVVRVKGDTAFEHDEVFTSI